MKRQQALDMLNEAFGDGDLSDMMNEIHDKIASNRVDPDDEGQEEEYSPFEHESAQELKEWMAEMMTDEDEEYDTGEHPTYHGEDEENDTARDMLDDRI